MAGASISVLDNPSDTDRCAILTPLDAFNKTKAGDENYEPIAIVLRNEAGEIVGGLWAQLYFDWVFIELLFIPENLRGENLGSKLLFQLEEIAKAKAASASGSIHSAFRRRAFTSDKAMKRFGTLEDYPKSMARFFFRKVL